MTRYRTIVADPPWDHSDGYAKRGGTGTRSWTNPREFGSVELRTLSYPVMTLAEIRALPVADLSQPDSRLFLWTTNRYMPDAYGVLGAWGFSYRQTLVWHKTNASPFTGSIAVGSAEFLLVGAKGKPGRVRKMPSSVIAYGHKHNHSQKPEQFLDWIEQASPGPYLELFARRQRLGWDTWGNEALGHVDLDGSAA